MRTPISGTQFRRDVKLARRRAKDMVRLHECHHVAHRERPAAAPYRDHPLAGDWKHFRECHIEPDWLLIYKVEGNDLYLVRTGTHSDLF